MVVSAARDGAQTAGRGLALMTRLLAIAPVSGGLNRHMSAPFTLPTQPVSRVRRLLVALLGLAGVLTGSGITPHSAAQPVSKTWRLGCMCDPNSPETKRFRERLQALGYIEGKNLQITFRPAFGDPKAVEQAVADLLRLTPDVLVTVAPPASHAAKRATQT